MQDSIITNGTLLDSPMVVLTLLWFQFPFTDQNQARSQSRAPFETGGVIITVATESDSEMNAFPITNTVKCGVHQPKPEVIGK